MSFKRSLDIGNKGQQIVTRILESVGLTVSSSVGKVTEWDLKVEGDISFVCEVKYDLYAARSGNVAIEIGNPNSGKASGLTATTAHLWFHVFHNPSEVWATSVSRLLDYCTKTKPFKEVIGGDGGNSHMFLYRKDSIADIFTVVSGIEQGKLVGVLHDLLHSSNSNG